MMSFEDDMIKEGYVFYRLPDDNSLTDELKGGLVMKLSEVKKHFISKKRVRNELDKFKKMLNNVTNSKHMALCQLFITDIMDMEIKLELKEDDGVGSFFKLIIRQDKENRWCEMIPEPLKGKVNDWECSDDAKRDVRSAAEWLKYKLRFYNNKDGIYQFIDEAFADVISKEAGR